VTLTRAILAKNQLQMLNNSNKFNDIGLLWAKTALKSITRNKKVQEIIWRWDILRYQPPGQCRIPSR
jgi:hypothetical protein